MFPSPSTTSTLLYKITSSTLAHLGHTGKTVLLPLYNLSVETGASEWKVVTIQPIPKPNDPTTMRPISLQSYPAKILVLIVLARLK